MLQTPYSITFRAQVKLALLAGALALPRTNKTPALGVSLGHYNVNPAFVKSRHLQYNYDLL